MGESEYVAKVDEYMSIFIHRIESELGHMKNFLKQQKLKFDGGGDFIRIDSCYSVNDNNDDKYGRDDGDPLGGHDNNGQNDNQNYSSSNMNMPMVMIQRPGPASKKLKMTSGSGQGSGQFSQPPSNKPLFCPAPNCRKRETSHLRLRIHIANNHKNLNDPNYPLWRCDECDWIGLFKTSLKDHVTKRHNKGQQQNDNYSPSYLTGSRKKTSSFTVHQSLPALSPASSGQFYSDSAEPPSDNSSNYTTANEGKRRPGRPIGTTKKKTDRRPGRPIGTTKKKKTGKKIVLSSMSSPTISTVPLPLLPGEKRRPGRPRVHFPPTNSAGNVLLESDDEIVEINPNDQPGLRKPSMIKSMISDIAGHIVRNNELNSNSDVSLYSTNNEVFRTNFVNPTEIMIKTEAGFDDPECQVILEGQEGQVELHENEFQIENRENQENFEIPPERSPPQSPSIIDTNTNFTSSIADDYNDPLNSIADL